MGGKNGVVDLAKRGIAPPADPRLQRVKIVAVDLSFVEELLQLDGSFPLRMDGWPKGAVSLARRIIVVQTADGKQVPQLEFIMHHPDFPIVLTRPERLLLRWTRVDLAPEEEAPEETA